MQEGALDEITFDWQYSFGNPMPEVDPTTGMPLVDSRGRPLAIYEKKFYWEYENTGKCTLSQWCSKDTSVSYPDNPDAKDYSKSNS